MGLLRAERLGRCHLTGRQLSARGVVAGVEREGKRVRLHSRAVMVLRAELLVPVLWILPRNGRAWTRVGQG